MKTALRVVMTVALTAAMGAGWIGGTALAVGDRAVPLKGSLEGTVSITPLAAPFAFVVITAGGNGTHLGNFTLHMPHNVNFATATGAGTFTLTAANGDTLTGTFTGHADTSAPVFVIEESGTITGGSGRFSGASGTIAFYRLFDPAAGTTTGTIEGMLSF